jgi:hypothetical protein
MRLRVRSSPAMSVRIDARTGELWCVSVSDSASAQAEATAGALTSALVMSVDGAPFWASDDGVACARPRDSEAKGAGALALNLLEPCAPTARCLRLSAGALVPADGQCHPVLALPVVSVPPTSDGSSAAAQRPEWLLPLCGLVAVAAGAAVGFVGVYYWRRRERHRAAESTSGRCSGWFKFRATRTAKVAVDTDHAESATQSPAEVASLNRLPILCSPLGHEL